MMMDIYIYLSLSFCVCFFSKKVDIWWFLVVNVL